MSPDQAAADAHLAEVEAEQAALRRIAALLARSVPAEEVFDAVVDEVRSLMGVDGAGLGRYEGDKTATVVAVSAEADARVGVPGDKLSTEGRNVTALVLRTGRPARIDDYTKATGGEFVRRFREAGVRVTVGAPVQVRERVWGCSPSTRCTGFYPRTRRRVWRTSPRWSQARLRTCRRGRSWKPRACGSSAPPMRRVGESCATFTMGRSSGSSRSPLRPGCLRSLKLRRPLVWTRSFEALRSTSRECLRNCARSLPGCTLPPCRAAASLPRWGLSHDVRLFRWCSMCDSREGR
jgi:GAF domain